MSHSVLDSTNPEVIAKLASFPAPPSKTSLIPSPSFQN